MPAGGSVSVPGHGDVSPQDAYLRAIALDRNNWSAWTGLGHTMLRGGSVSVPGHGDVTQQDAFLRAIALNQDRSDAWGGLGWDSHDARWREGECARARGWGSDAAGCVLARDRVEPRRLATRTSGPAWATRCPMAGGWCPGT
eukprot:TRINITY_DN3520_c0_g1_i11.p5 TRINITY_DN3520_c0_g1~~TRINITY_DN3520_c0_g1_i11.p5  ORF type:complete len:142 (+),score=2.64 TRINITY_DN3520_c0_g1_i11:330-755(+)